MSNGGIQPFRICKISITIPTSSYKSANGSIQKVACNWMKSALVKTAELVLILLTHLCIMFGIVRPCDKMIQPDMFRFSKSVPISTRKHIFQSNPTDRSLHSHSLILPSKIPTRTISQHKTTQTLTNIKYASVSHLMNTRCFTSTVF